MKNTYSKGIEKLQDRPHGKIPKKRPELTFYNDSKQSAGNMPVPLGRLPSAVHSAGQIPMERTIKKVVRKRSQHFQDGGTRASMAVPCSFVVAKERDLGMCLRL